MADHPRGSKVRLLTFSSSVSSFPGQVLNSSQVLESKSTPAPPARIFTAFKDHLKEKKTGDRMIGTIVILIIAAGLSVVVWAIVDRVRAGQRAAPGKPEYDARVLP